MVKDTEGIDNFFLGDQAGYRCHCCFPRHIADPAQRIENPGYRIADQRQQRAVVIFNRLEDAVHKAVAL